MKAVKIARLSNGHHIIWLTDLDVAYEADLDGEIRKYEGDMVDFAKYEVNEVDLLDVELSGNLTDGILYGEFSIRVFDE